ncbi:MAG TPA: biotin/lipoyl-containing protein [Candidatus Baltobacteraceae bacterium]|nr:biotin/lipoyl-containing protein [Candidatus Baltobacteraceae bacterium]
MTGEREALERMLELMRNYDLDALTLRVGESTYELVLRPETPAGALPASASLPAPAPAGAPATAAANFKKVTAPIIGVFYRSASPGAEPFVEVGDRVEVGQVLCILEAMKLMNEITSDFAGVVRRILPENGALVSLGEEMFWIEP